MYSSQWNCSIMEPFQIIRGDQAQIYVVPNCIEFPHYLAQKRLDVVHTYIGKSIDVEEMSGVETRRGGFLMNNNIFELDFEY